MGCRRYMKSWEIKETENECRHTSWPDCLLPSHLCLCWWEDWGRRVWKSHTHTHTRTHHAGAALFCLFQLIGGTDWASRRRLTFDVSFEKITPLRATDQSRWQCNFDLCMCVCHIPSSPAHTPSTPPSWSTYVRKWEWRRCCRLLHSNTEHNSQGANYPGLLTSSPPRKSKLEFGSERKYTRLVFIFL